MFTSRFEVKRLMAALGLFIVVMIFSVWWLIGPVALAAAALWTVFMGDQDITVFIEQWMWLLWGIALLFAGRDVETMIKRKS